MQARTFTDKPRLAPEPPERHRERGHAMVGFALAMFALIPDSARSMSMLLHHFWKCARPLPLNMASFIRRRGWAAGQIMPVLALVIVGLLGSISLCTDIAVDYYNWAQLRKAADAAVLAGANYLPDNPSQAIQTASQMAQSNGVKSSEIVSNTVATNDLSITMSISRTVPFYFARALGLTSGTISVTATGAPQFPTSTVGASTPAQVAGGDNNGNNGVDCGAIGKCGLIPIGLDSHTVYSDGEQIILQQGEVGPGNWDLLALGGTGGSNLRSNIADGYSGPVSVNDWVTTEPGKKVGPVDQGFQDRLTLGQNSYSGGTYLLHSFSDPRVLVIPMVNWEGQNGRSQVQVTGFASVWLDSYSSGQVTVNFISQVIANSFGSSTAGYFGARGVPILTQ